MHRYHLIINRLLAISLLLLSTGAVAQTSLTTITVTTNANDGPGSLRAAITAGNSTSAPYTINITATGSIGLTAALPEITESCTITGRTSLVPATGSGGTLIERVVSQEFRILHMVQTNKSLTLRDLILGSGRSMPKDENYDGLGGGGLLASLGTGTLTMTRCLIINCRALFDPDAGGVNLLSGNAVITDCQFSGNETTSGNGGAFRCGGGTATFQRCTFVGNSSTFDGGAFVQVNTSTTMTNCTFSSNSTSFGAGNAIYSGTNSSLNLIHCSFVANSGESQTINQQGSVKILNCLFDGNTFRSKPGNFDSPYGITSLGGNISSTDLDNEVLTSTSDKTNQPIRSGPLRQNNGGLVSTHALGECSPARNAGISPAPLTLPPGDANGRSRSIPPDAGAFEYTGPPVSVVLSASNDGLLTCADASLTLTAAATGSSSFQYVFSGPGQNTAPTGTATTSASAVGTYSVTVTSAEGCSASATVSVSGSTVAVGAVGLSSAGLLGCNPSAVTLTASSARATTYSISPAAAATLSAGVYRITAARTYTISAGNGLDGCSQFTTITVSSNTATPGISLTATDNGILTCAVQALTLTAASPTGGVSYSFSSPAAFTTTGNRIAVNTASTYSVTATNPTNGCRSFTSTAITSNTTAPGVSLNATNSGVITCAFPALTLTAGSATGGVSYSFSSPAAFTASASQLTVNAADTYSVTATNPANGCRSFTSTTITSNTAAPGVSLTATGNGVLTCAVRTLTATAASAAGGVSFSFAGPAITNTTATAISLNGPGPYSVTATNPVNGCVSSATTAITSSTETPGISLMATNNGVLLCGIQTLTLTAASPANGVSYSFASANSFTTQAADAIAVSETGPYSVSAINPATGCFSTTSLNVSSNLVPPGAVSISRTGAIGCGPNSVTLSATAGGATSFSLLPGNQTNLTGQFAVTAIGTYTLVAANGRGTACQSLTTNTIRQGTSATAGNITADGTAGCNAPVRLTVPATGKSFVFTGPDGYVFSTVYRQTGAYTVFAGNVVLGGTYTLTVQSDEGCPAVTRTVVIQGPGNCP